MSETKFDPSTFKVCEVWIKAETDYSDFNDVEATLFADGRIEFDRPVYDPRWARETAAQAFMDQDQDILTCDDCDKLFDSADFGRIEELSGKKQCDACNDKEMAANGVRFYSKKAGAS